MRNYFELRKLAIRMSNAIKGFIRTITGKPPITLESCVDDNSVINYQIYGKSTQDGEPSPDNPVDVVSVGEYDEETGKYKIPVKAYPNEFINDYLYTPKYNPNNTYMAIPIQLKPNTNYNLSCAYNSRSSYIVLTVNDLYGGSKVTKIVWLSHITEGDANNLVPGVGKIFTTTDSGMVYIGCPNFWSGDNARKTILDNFNGSLVIRESAMKPITTNIYLNEPLRHIGDYKDCIDFESGKLVRQIAESQMLSKYILSKASASNETSLVLLVNSNNPFGKAKTGSYGGKLFNSIGKAFSWNHGTIDGMVSWYNNVSGNKISFFAIPVNFLTDRGNENTLAGGKAWIDAQNAISPIMITFVLEKSTEEAIDLSNLPTFKGNTTYTINTTVQPSNMSVTYWSNKKGE